MGDAVDAILIATIQELIIGFLVALLFFLIDRRMEKRNKKLLRAIVRISSSQTKETSVQFKIKELIKKNEIVEGGVEKDVAVEEK